MLRSIGVSIGLVTFAASWNVGALKEIDNFQFFGIRRELVGWDRQKLTANDDG